MFPIGNTIQPMEWNVGFVAQRRTLFESSSQVSVWTLSRSVNHQFVVTVVGASSGGGGGGGCGYALAIKRDALE